jgi:hypothetical protein
MHQNRVHDRGADANDDTNHSHDVETLNECLPRGAEHRRADAAGKLAG